MSRKEAWVLLENEQRYLWNDLNDALHHRAINGHWSIAIEGIIQRIIWIAEEVGCTDWGHVQLPLVASGIYNEVRVKMGLDPVNPDLSDYTEHCVYPEVWGLTPARIRDMVLEEM